METSIPAPYGQACTNCARTKCRCILRGKNLSCERCHRLNKQCVPAPYTRKRGGKRQTRAAQLEEKLEDLVTLLKSQTGDKPPSPPSPNLEPASGLACFSGLGRLTPLPSAAASPTDIAAPGDLSAEEEEACLELFKSTYLEYFPFVHIPEGTSVRSVKASRPFFWMVVVGLTGKVTARKGATMGKIEEALARRVVVNHERDVDLLLGVVALLGWLGYQGRGKPYMWLFIHLAMTIAGDLGLDRPNLPVTGVRGISLTGGSYNSPSTKAPSLEETRVVLGCYITCSVIGGFFQRPNPMPWSPTLQHNLEVLRDAGETPRDQLLIAQAQMYRLIDELAQSPWRNPDVTRYMGPDMSPIYHMRSLSARLEDIMQGVTDPEIAQSQPLHLVHQTVQVGIHELILHYTPPSPPHDIDHLNHLYTALNSTRTWFETFFSRPIHHYIATTLALYGGFLVACHTLHRLTLLEAPGWDRAAVRSTADLLSILDRTADVMAEVPRMAGINNTGAERDDVFTRAATLLRGQRAACAAVMEPVDEVRGEEEMGGIEFQEMMGFSEGVWMHDMFGGAWGGNMMGS